MDPTVISSLVMIILLILLILMGVPISISVGLSSIVTLLIFVSLDKATALAANRIFSGINSFSLLAIPFFILAGSIMNTGGIAKRLVNFAKLFTGRLPGSLAQTNIIANMIFGAVSGSAAAGAAAVGGIMGPMQEEEGYGKKFSTAVNIASAPSGMLIPPSNTLIIYSTVAGTVSISALFMAGYIPGILWGIGNMIVAGVMAKKLGYKGSSNNIPLRDKIKIILSVTLDAIPSLLLIVIVIGGILKGIFTASESSVIAVVYATILSGVFYKSLKLKDVPRVLLESANITGIVIFIIGVSTIMSYVMAYTEIPKTIAETFLSITTNKYILLLIMNVVLLIIGTFMDPTPAILIFAPIFLPICQSFGMDPIQFGIIITFNLSIGCMTPPVGTIMFTGCRVANMKIEDVIKTLIPFVVVTILILFLVTYLEPISMAIPRMIGL